MILVVNVIIYVMFRYAGKVEGKEKIMSSQMNTYVVYNMVVGQRGKERKGN